MKIDPFPLISEKTAKQLVKAIGELVCTINRQIDSTSRITNLVSKDREVKELEKASLNRIDATRSEALGFIRDLNKEKKKD
ncbi:MAG: hypothetical protein HOD92_26050 [Deltaproteobacteria bacterium]|jgi:hypothetical protein|nr:hypothetical protein [Deltaproteobacteria bacterium]